MNPGRTTEDPYEAGVRAGYAHGYEVGLAHGRAEAAREIDYVDLPAPRVGPSQDELRARGQIPIDHSRPPALPVRLWMAEDWAKADERDLPTTEHGHAQWRDAIAAGHVPPHLADAYAAAAQDRVQAQDGRPGPARPAVARSGRVDLESADAVTRAVADTERVLAALRSRLAPSEPTAAARRPEAAVPERERGIAR